ncbi:MAG: FkbM family methyltransferase [Pseudomonadota bacterium]
MTEDSRKNLRQRIRFLLDALDLSARPVVCDVGANPIYVPSYMVLKRQGGCDVIGFEPQKEAYDQLVAAASDQETYVNAALGKPGPATLYAYKSQGFTSLYRLRKASLDMLQRYQPQLATEQEIAVELQALDDLEDLPPIDLLKIDVQGAELDIISGGQKALSQAVAIIPEVRFLPLYENEPSFAELDTELRRQGFTLHKLLDPVVQMLPSPQRDSLVRKVAASQWVDGDAVYVRNLEGMAEWSDAQLRNLALFAATVFNSQDLALMCLARLSDRGAAPKNIGAQYATLLQEKYFKHGEARAAS